MSKKILLSIAAIFLVACGIMAQSRSAAEAVNVANSFLSKQGMGKINSEGEPVYTAKSKLRGSGAKDFFYVFNRENNGGFVVVSADSRAKAVLGYSNNGSFNAERLPDNFRSWLSFYEREIESLDSKPLRSVSTGNSEVVTKFSPIPDFLSNVPPIIKTRWGQEDPYNLFCPVYEEERLVVGCVATAIAQIMKYHNYPARGRGNHSYISDELQLPVSADFETDYDWANMTDIYNSNSTDVQREAVAKLMFHVGVAVDMSYNLAETGGSGAWTHNIPPAWVKFFDYDPGIQYLERIEFNSYDWINILKRELIESRPVFYSGGGRSGGHAFVCDGYDSNNLFHMNWGWDGMSDGYFELSSLNPDEYGTGGGSGAFSYGQSIVIGIRPNVNSENPERLAYNKISVGKTSLASLEETFELSIYVRNTSHAPFPRPIGYAIFSEDYEFFSHKILSSEPMEYNPTEFKEIKSADTKLPDLSPGLYRIVPAYVLKDDPDKVALMESIQGAIHYIEVQVKADKTVALRQSVRQKPVLKINKFSAYGNLYQDRKGVFMAEIENSGNVDYRSVLRINFKDQPLFFEDDIMIEAGKTTEIFFAGSMELAPGDYSVDLLYDLNDPFIDGEVNNFAVLGSTNVTVKASPGAPDLVLISGPEFPDVDAVNKANPQISFKVKNNGGLFEGVFGALISPPNTEEVLVALTGSEIRMDKDSTKQIILNGVINLSPGNYRLRILALTSDGERIELSSHVPFTLVEASSATDKVGVESAEATFNSGLGLLEIKSSAIVRSAQVFNLNGLLQAELRPNSAGPISFEIGHLPAAIYIVRIETESGVKTSKFVKSK